MAEAYKSEALAALHESMSDLHQVGAIDSKTMREFDRTCLTPVMKLSPAAIRRIRTRAAVSQAATRKVQRDILEARFGLRAVI